MGEQGGERGDGDKWVREGYRKRRKEQWGNRVEREERVISG